MKPTLELVFHLTKGKLCLASLTFRQLLVGVVVVFASSSLQYILSFTHHLPNSQEQVH